MAKPPRTVKEAATILEESRKTTRPPPNHAAQNRELKTKVSEHEATIDNLQASIKSLRSVKEEQTTLIQDQGAVIQKKNQELAIKDADISNGKRMITQLQEQAARAITWRKVAVVSWIVTFLTVVAHFAT